jgi:hypothetical protein
MINQDRIYSAAFNKLFCLVLILICSCGRPKLSNKISDLNNAQEINHDSLINILFKYGKQYLDFSTTYDLIALKGTPLNSYKTQWGDTQDSLTTFYYPKMVFKFFQGTDSFTKFLSCSILDNSIPIPGNIIIGYTTRRDILQILGLPDFDHNDPGRSITKSGDSTVYGTQSGAGDTVTFSYNINIDEYEILFSMTKDTLRKIIWSKNPY